jgi:hypothetical protein
MRTRTRRGTLKTRSEGGVSLPYEKAMRSCESCNYSALNCCCIFLALEIRVNKARVEDHTVCQPWRIQEVLEIWSTNRRVLMQIFLLRMILRIRVIEWTLLSKCLDIVEDQCFFYISCENQSYVMSSSTP